jgi:SAM-dependent methyltransferase
MGHRACFEFGERNLAERDIRGKDILEVGSSIDGGSMRPYVESFSPRKYIGIDIQLAPGVDEICDVHDLMERFGPESFDVVIANELMEHVRDWRRVIRNFKAVLRNNGIVILTTRSHGFPFHLAPFDFWRFEIADMRAIFGDFAILAVEPDPSFRAEGIPMHGVFVAARKRKGVPEIDLRQLDLFSIIKGRRVHEVWDRDIYWYELRQLGWPYFCKFRGIPFLAREYLRKSLPAPIKTAVKRLIGSG